MVRTLIVAVGVVLVSCGPGTSTGVAVSAPAAVPNVPEHRDTTPDTSPLQLRLDQAADFDGLVLTWISIDDSRCPEGVMCAWAGEATVRIRVHDGAEDTTIALTLGASPGDGAVKTSRHELRLIAVEPHPRHGTEVARDARRATVSIERR